MKALVGIDLGGTDIKAVAVSSTGEILAQRILATGDDGSSDWRARVVQAATELKAELQLEQLSFGLAAPGLPAADGLSIAHLPSRLRGLEGFQWQTILGATAPVPVINDAQACLLGESWLGAARGAQNALLLTLGTGVGGAIMLDGKILRGHHRRAGHLGHISLNPFGPLDLVNTPGSLEDAIGNCTIVERSEGRFATTAELVAAVGTDPFAAGIWDKSLQALAAGLAGMINILDPEMIVIGGGIAQAGDALFRPLQLHLDRVEWRPGGARVKIIPTVLGKLAGALGAARAGHAFPF